ncbi:MAG: squalene/phytoene synthase family protein [Pseudomonadota bacterium]
MTFDERFVACAQRVEAGDPDRFAAVMISPVAARPVLFSLYAANLEIARAPWVSNEPMIAEMRLQWWRDAFDEIVESKSVRRHEIVTPLAHVIDVEAARNLADLVDARRQDIKQNIFEDQSALDIYLDRTAGTLMWTAARLLGAPAWSEQMVRRVGQANGLARYLQAVAALEAQGRVPLIDGRPKAIAALAHNAQQTLGKMQSDHKALPAAAKPALLEAFQAAALLKRAAHTPQNVADGTLTLAPLHRSWLLWRASRR